MVLTAAPLSSPGKRESVLQVCVFDWLIASFLYPLLPNKSKQQSTTEGGTGKEKYMTNRLESDNIKLVDAVLSAVEGLTHLFGDPYARYERSSLKGRNK
jgi:hypothetical protein